MIPRDMLSPTAYRLTRKGTHWPVMVYGLIFERWERLVSLGTVAEAEGWVAARGGTILRRNIRGVDGETS